MIRIYRARAGHSLIFGVTACAVVPPPLKEQSRHEERLLAYQNEFGNQTLCITKPQPRV